jgi:hypothetical protein
MNAHGAMVACLRLLFTTALDGSEWSASLAGRFISGEETCAVHLIKGWMDHTAGLDVLEKTISLRSSS